MVAVRTIEGKDEYGDATVPRLSAAPSDVDPGSAIIRYVADNHGGLVHNRSVFEEIEGALTAPVRHRGGGIRLCVDVEEVLDDGEPLRVWAELLGNDRVALEALVAASQGRLLDVIRLRTREGARQADVDLPGPGVYQVTVRGVGAARTQVTPVTTAVFAWPPESSFDADDLARG